MGRDEVTDRHFIKYIFSEISVELVLWQSCIYKRTSGFWLFQGRKL